MERKAQFLDVQRCYTFGLQIGIFMHNLYAISNDIATKIDRFYLFIEFQQFFLVYSMYILF